MNLNAFDSTVALVSNYGYFVVFLIMIAEGPIITTAAGFAAGVGIFNIYIIYLLSVLGDTVADVLYFWIGSWGRTALIEKYGPRFGLTKKRLEKIQLLLQNNTWKTIIAIKLTPGLAPPGLAAVGASKMSPRKYFKTVFLVTLPKCLFFVALGFYAARFNDTVLKYFRMGIYGFPIIFVLVLLAFYVFEKFLEHIAKKLEKI